MPSPQKNETRDEFIKRCVKIVIDEGTANSVKQALAICYSMWERSKEKASSTMNKQISNNEYLICSSDAKVQASDEKRDEIIIVAYTGSMMKPMGYIDNVVVDLDGVAFDKSVVPIILDHDTGLRFGHSTEQYILKNGETLKIGNSEFTGPAIILKAIRSSNMSVAKGVMDDIKNGFPFQASIGATVVDYKFVDDDDMATINGEVFKGPLYWVKNSKIREVSLTVLGADSKTNVRIAASLRGAKMTFNEWIKSVGVDPETLSEDGKLSLKAAYDAYVELLSRDISQGDNKKMNDDKQNDDKSLLASELTRIEAINAIADEFSDIKSLEVEVDGKRKKFSLASFKAHAIRNNWSPEKFELECRRAMYPTMNGPSIHVKQEVNYDDFAAKAVECAILRASGVPARAFNRSTNKEYGYELMFDEKVIEASYNKKYNVNNSLDNLCRMQIMAVGKHPTSFDPKELFAQAYDSWGMVKAGSVASTFSLTNILENVMYKAALAAFEAAESTWRNIASTRSLNDFRPHNLYRLTLNGSFKKVGPDGELKHITMSDEKYTIQAETYGAMIAIDRRTQIDDDLGLVVQRAREIGSLAALRLEEAVYVTLLSNPNNFFSTANNNLISGATSALGLGALEIARKKFRDQVINGKPINITPSILLVGTALENIAVKLWSQDRYEIAGTSGSVTREFTNNQFVGMFRPVVTPYLNNTSITDQDGKPISGQSDTQWYLFANPGAPQGSAVVVGFLNGRTTPFFDEAETSFSVPGGIQMRSYYDFGVALHVPQMCLKSTGA